MTNNPFELLRVAPDTAFDGLQNAYQLCRAKAIAEQANDETLRTIDEAYRAALESLSQRQASTHLSVLPTQAVAVYNPPMQPKSSAYNPTELLSQALKEQVSPSTFATIDCPNCGIPNPAQVTVCQQCGSQISRTCTVCAAQIPLYASVCQRCGAPVNEVAKNKALQANDASQKIEQERFEENERILRHEQRHATRAVYGTVFWLVVTVALVALCGLALFAYWSASQLR